ncbi:uncharacterized protein LOC124489941 [Dermatophagoides farinae]|uniref:uncharacterized protein LOC124489941 n=1 Tax=Dermatophagoides farinae TaxID=6954 RepID=UPI003F6253FB
MSQTTTSIPSSSSKSSPQRCVQDYYYQLKNKFDLDMIKHKMSHFNQKPLYREFIVYYKMATMFIRPMGIFYGTMINEFRSIIPYNRIRRSTGEIGWLPFISDDRFLIADRNYLVQTIDKSNQISALIIPKESGQVTVLGETFYGFRFDAKTLDNVHHDQNHLEVKGNLLLGQYSDQNGWEIKENRIPSDCIVEVLCGTLSVIICDYRWIALIPDLNCRISMKLLFEDDGFEIREAGRMSEVQISGLDLLQQRASAAETFKSIERQQKRSQRQQKRSQDTSRTTMTISTSTGTNTKSETSSLVTPISISPLSKQTEQAKDRIRELYGQKRHQQPQQQPIPAPVDVYRFSSPKKTMKTTSSPPIKLLDKQPKSIQILIDRALSLGTSTKPSAEKIIDEKTGPEKMEQKKQDSKNNNDDMVQSNIPPKSKPIVRVKSKPMIELPKKSASIKMDEFKIKIKSTLDLMKEQKSEPVLVKNVIDDPESKITGVEGGGKTGVTNVKHHQTTSIAKLNEPLLSLQLQRHKSQTLSSPSLTTTTTTTTESEGKLSSSSSSKKKKKKSPSTSSKRKALKSSDDRSKDRKKSGPLSLVASKMMMFKISPKTKIEQVKPRSSSRLKSKSKTMKTDQSTTALRKKSSPSLSHRRRSSGDRLKLEKSKFEVIKRTPSGSSLTSSSSKSSKTKRKKHEQTKQGKKPRSPSAIQKVKVIVPPSEMPSSTSARSLKIRSPSITQQQQEKSGKQESTTKITMTNNDDQTVTKTSAPFSSSSKISKNKKRRSKKSSGRRIKQQAAAKTLVKNSIDGLIKTKAMAKKNDNFSNKKKK